MIRSYIGLVGLLLLLMSPAWELQAQADSPNSTIRRIVLVVGANNGGPRRTTLRYAVTDAERMAKITEELGGVLASDIIRLSDSKLDSLRKGLATMERRLIAAKAPGVRVEALFYYSGHSNETGLLLDGEQYSYKELRRRIEHMPAEIKIAILDSCASGAFTRTKGGTKRPAFLVDESSRVNGYALIASSSATELAQESDRIASSFFTHYFVSGLRGAADSNRDGRVTLNEAYQHAFDETVARTESTQNGTQHPAYNMHLAGTGDVVMTDLRSTSASLIVGKGIVGRLFIRDSRGNLVIELSKRQRHAMMLGLASGRYSVILMHQGRLSRANITLVDGKSIALASSDFRAFKGEVAVARGDLAGFDSGIYSADIRTEYFGASLLPSLSTSSDNVRRNVSINLLGGSIRQLYGFELGIGLNRVSDSIHGLQISGILNMRGGELTGLQLAGIANLGTGKTHGLQVAGIVNTSTEAYVGAQLAGISNLNNGSFSGLQVSGIANHVQGQFRGIQAAGVTNFTEGADGLQMAGIGNFSNGDVEGIQIAGIVNRSAHVHGAQVSGIGNMASSVEGMQLSLVNVSTGRVRGLQIGLVNVAKESDVSIGLINVIENGYRSAETWTSATTPIAIGYKMGSKRFYTMLALAQSFNNETLAGFGAGVHTPYGNGEYYFDIDALAFSPVSFGDDRDFDDNDILAKFRVTLGWHINRDLSLIGGISLNTSHSFDSEGKAEGLVHKEYRRRSYVLRYGPGVFAGVAWSLGK